MQTRRRFLSRSLGGATLLALGPTAPEFLCRTARAAANPPADGHVLVVLQLTGGNDGLNTVVPFDDDAYGRARPTLRLKGSQVLRLNTHLGLHPRLTALKKLYDDGLLGIVQGVGYPNPNRNHGGAMQVWQSANVKPGAARTGWLGRTVDRVYKPDDTHLPAAYVGGLGLPFALRGERALPPAIRNLNECQLVGRDAAGQAWQAALAKTPPPADDANPLTEFLARTALDALATSHSVEKVLQQPAGAYPRLGLAQRLSTIAQLIRADLGIRIFYTELGGNEPGGFDNHANQADNHGVLLAELADSLLAFTNDLKRDRLLDRVTLMTFSEFGRSLDENGRRGTDHGSAAPLFLAGGRIKPGLIGKHPSLTDLDGNAPRAHTDFRQVYATLLEQWLGYDAESILGGKYAPVAMLG